MCILQDKFVFFEREYMYSMYWNDSMQVHVHLYIITTCTCILYNTCTV